MSHNRAHIKTNSTKFLPREIISAYFTRYHFTVAIAEFQPIPLADSATLRGRITFKSALNKNRPTLKVFKLLGRGARSAVKLMEVLIHARTNNALYQHGVGGLRRAAPQHRKQRGAPLSGPEEQHQSDNREVAPEQHQRHQSTGMAAPKD